MRVPTVVAIGAIACESVTHAREKPVQKDSVRVIISDCTNPEAGADGGKRP